MELRSCRVRHAWMVASSGRPRIGIFHVSRCLHNRRKSVDKLQINEGAKCRGA